MKRKPVLGEIIYDLNIGNAARNRESKLTPVIVCNIGRKYFKCSPEDWPENLVMYNIEDWSEKSEYAPNHKLYETRKEYDEENETRFIAERMRTIFSKWGKCEIPLEKLRAINEILIDFKGGSDA